MTHEHPKFVWVTGALMSLVLVAPGAYHLLTLWLALYGAWHAKGLAARVIRPSLEIGALPIWLGLLAYTLFGVLNGLLHAERLSFFEAYVPMLLAPLIVNAAVVARPPATLIWLGAASAAILAGLVASYQSLLLNVGRAGGAMNNIIMFGDLSVLMAMIAACGLVFRGQGPAGRWRTPYLAAGAILGVCASLLSGTKGGWLSMLTLGVIFGWALLKHRSLPVRALTVLAVLLAIVGLGALMPGHLVSGRIVEGVRSGYHWLSTGEVVDRSVSIRLEMWRQALQMIALKPWGGWGTAGAILELDVRLKPILGNGWGSPGWVWTQVESDLLQAGMNYGLPNVLSYLAMYLGLMFGFWRIRPKQGLSPAWVGLATAGLILPVLMLEFGLSVVVLGRNAFRHTFIVWSMLMLASLINLHNQGQSKR